jgi:hypothetical protein
MVSLREKSPFTHLNAIKPDDIPINGFGTGVFKTRSAGEKLGATLKKLGAVLGKMRAKVKTMGAPSGNWGR